MSRPSHRSTVWEDALGFFVDNKLIVVLLLGLLVASGVYVAPFAWDTGLPTDRVPVDAIPDIGENQQIVFTEWPGRSPRDVEDQIGYPLSSALLGIPGVRTVRSSSMFGYSSIYVIFEEGVEFYWSRARLLEKLSSLPAGTLPEGVAPTLGPDATALGQVFWYTLEGHGPDGAPVGGWDLHELRSIQDWTLRFALQSVPGVAEVASIGGHVQEYQVDVDPDAMAASNVTIGQVAAAVRNSNLDVGARTLEINRAEYLVRGLGFIGSVSDLEQTVVGAKNNTPIRIADVARVTLGPEQRRGALDDAGAETVGGIVVVRFGENPLEVIERVKAKIAEVAPGLPKRELEDGRISQVTVVPYYDRTTLINETLDTLSTALIVQVLVAIIVVLVMLRNLRTSILVSSVLPVSVLGAFVAMKVFGVDANIMALGGIAIAIGTMVDMSIVLVENIVEHLRKSAPGESTRVVITRAAAEVAPAITTSALTTVVSFIPVFALTGSEGRLFSPVAFTKSFAIIAALLVSMLVLPAACHLVLRKRRQDSDAHEPTLRLSKHYTAALRWALEHKAAFVLAPALTVVLGIAAWLDLGREFMPPFDEGSFLYMPTTMPHASFGQALEMLKAMDAAIEAIPEVDRAVGKLGRAQTALDPAPASMFETVVTYKPEYGHDNSGRSVRQWRDHIHSPDDIWNEIVNAAQAPGLTNAPKLMPINTRIIMLQSGMRAPMGIKVQGPDLDTIDAFGRTLEQALKSVPAIRPQTVFADRIVGKPYLEIDIDRKAIGRYGLTIGAVQEVIQLALGGKTLTTTVEGRERYAVRVRYMREERDSIEALGRVLIPSPDGAQIPLGQLATIRYTKGPQLIRSENTFLASYVLFDQNPNVSEVEAVQAARSHIDKLIREGQIEVPSGVSYRFTGAYENQVRSEQRLMLLVPLALAIIMLILYVQFRRISTTLIVYSGVAITVAGGFILVWLYGRPMFLRLPIVGDALQSFFQVGTVNMSVAVWVGFIALVGIATDTGVLMATTMAQRLQASPPQSLEDIRDRVVQAAGRRLRPCLMTTATTALALLPVITSTGRGADVMMPMALPSIGGMVAILLTLFVVPVLYAWVEERRLTSELLDSQRQ